MGIPRFLASASQDEQLLAWHAAAMIGAETPGSVCLLQCGRASSAAAFAAKELEKHGRKSFHLVIEDRATANTERAANALGEAVAVWVFADSLLAAFLIVFSTSLAFALRKRTREGFLSIGYGGGALALGGLLLAKRVCTRSQYDLVSGLGWAPRVLLDADLFGDGSGGGKAGEAVASLPQLLAVRLGTAGAVRVEGGLINSIGSERVALTGLDPTTGYIRGMTLAQGSSIAIAPPPFAPFEWSLLPHETAAALRAGTSVGHSERVVSQPPQLTHAPLPPEPETPATNDQSPVEESPALVTGEVAPTARTFAAHEASTTGLACPLCNQVHVVGDFVQMAA